MDKLYKYEYLYKIFSNGLRLIFKLKDEGYLTFFGHKKYGLSSSMGDNSHTTNRFRLSILHKISIQKIVDKYSNFYSILSVIHIWRFGTKVSRKTFKILVFMKFSESQKTSKIQQNWGKTLLKWAYWPKSCFTWNRKRRAGCFTWNVKWL